MATQTQTMKQAMADILLDISWAKISTKYFGKSRSWLYHKMNGIDSNGGVGGFSEQEEQQLKEALKDLARRINNCADKI